MRLFYSIILCFLFSFVHAQQQTFFAKRSGSSFFLEHKVVAKENWYSVGRIYMISPKDIASFNGLSIEKGLGIGQILEIPLTKSNFSQSSDAVDGGLPVVHIVQPKETLSKLSNSYQVNINILKKWNALKSDQVNSGFKLVVGYVKIASPTKNESAALRISKQIEVPASVPASSPAISKVNDESEKPLKTSVAPEPKPNQSPTSEKPVQGPPISTEEELKDNGTGHFFQMFNIQSKEGVSKKIDQPVYGTFKSTSGWQDGKYYVLMNNVVPGTVVRIKASQTGKEIYAKVLAPVPSGKESEGMVLRMSNASAAALGLGEATNGNLQILWNN